MYLLCRSGFAAEKASLTWWSFDEAHGRAASDRLSSAADPIEGNFRHIQGVRGAGIKCDGFTTRIVRKASQAPRLTGSFTIEAWVAPQAYPWNWCAIVNQQKDQQAGYFFGIDDMGHVGLHLAVEAAWHECNSEKTIPFMDKWSHIVGTFDKDKGMTVYIDANAVAFVPVKGTPTFAPDMDLQIARNHEKTPLNPQTLVRKSVDFPTSYSFDGIIDEVKIYSCALGPHEIADRYRESNLPARPRSNGESCLNCQPAQTHSEHSIAA